MRTAVKTSGKFCCVFITVLQSLISFFRLFITGCHSMMNVLKYRRGVEEHLRVFSARGEVVAFINGHGSFIQILARSVPLSEVIIVDRIGYKETAATRKLAFESVIALWKQLQLPLDNLTIVGDNFSHAGFLEDATSFRSIFPTAVQHLPRFLREAFETLNIHRHIEDFDRKPEPGEIFTLFEKNAYAHVRELLGVASSEDFKRELEGNKNRTIAHYSFVTNSAWDEKSGLKGLGFDFSGKDPMPNVPIQEIEGIYHNALTVTLLLDAMWRDDRVRFQHYGELFREVATSCSSSNKSNKKEMMCK